eukprot:UN02744
MSNNFAQFLNGFGPQNIVVNGQNMNRNNQNNGNQNNNNNQNQPNQPNQPIRNFFELLSQMGGVMSGGNVQNIGDYGFGPISQIIAGLQDPNRHGPPPASKEEIAKIPEVDITQK